MAKQTAACLGSAVIGLHQTNIASVSVYSSYILISAMTAAAAAAAASTHARSAVASKLSVG